MIKSLSQILESLKHLHGLKRALACFVAGAAVAFAFPPYHQIWILWLAFPAYALMWQAAKTQRQAFAVGWFFSFGLLTFSLYWIAGALFVDIKTYWALVPLAVAGLPALFAIYYGLGSLLAWRFGGRGLVGILSLALAWALADLARGHLFTGFPWDILGYVFADYLPMAQIASLCGVDGLTLLTAWLALVPVSFLFVSRKLAWRAFGGTLLVFAAFLTWGSFRLAQTQVNPVPLVRLRLVQPDQSQRGKWRHEERQAHFESLKKISFANLDADGAVITHIVWPETATAFLLAEDQEARRSIGDAMGLGSGRVLMTGALRREIKENGGFRYFNSFLAIDDLGRLVAQYDKHHLVPFGEYIPFRSILPFHGIAAMGADFTPGPGPQTLFLDGFPAMSPLICYEAIFSGEVVAPSKPRPQVLVNVTNDAWYEGTTGPDQHFAIARMRAIEEGMPLVRDANKGVVAVVDPVGRIWAEYQGKGIGKLDTDLPQALSSTTLFFKYGDAFVITIIFAALFVIILANLIINRSKRGLF